MGGPRRSAAVDKHLAVQVASVSPEDLAHLLESACGHAHRHRPGRRGGGPIRLPGSLRQVADGIGGPRAAGSTGRDPAGARGRRGKQRIGTEVAEPLTEASGLEILPVGDRLEELRGVLDGEPDPLSKLVQPLSLPVTVDEPVQRRERGHRDKPFLDADHALTEAAQNSHLLVEDPLDRLAADPHDVVPSSLQPVAVGGWGGAAGGADHARSVPGGLQQPGPDAADGGEVVVPDGLEPPDACVQGTHVLVVVGLRRRVGSRLFVGRLAQPRAVGAGVLEGPEGLLGVAAHPGHLPLGGRECVGEAGQRPGDLGEGALRGVQVRRELGHPGLEQVAFAADPAAGVQPAQGGGRLGRGGGKAPIGAAQLVHRLGVALDRERVRGERVGRHG